LAGRGYRALLCCNLLEHVPDPAAMCAKLERLLPAGGYIMVSVPHRFPYRHDVSADANRGGCLVSAL
jgi:2-polyprenyl-3-methyl-5-hydroxy-6-metoxy-1,4-benzoquinol methylase